jgi:hypothetical protein
VRRRLKREVPAVITRDNPDAFVGRSNANDDDEDDAPVTRREIKQALDHAINKETDMIGSEVGIREREIRARYDSRLSELSDRIDRLESDIQDLYARLSEIEANDAIDRHARALRPRVESILRKVRRVA